MMFLVSLYRIFKTAMSSLWRNRLLSLAATLIMVMTLFTISFFASVLFVTSKTTNYLNDKADISVYFNEDVSKEKILALMNDLLVRSDVENVEYISKELALTRWKEWQGKKYTDAGSGLQDVINETSNPLPRSLDIRANKPSDLETINAYLNSDDVKPIVRHVSYEQNKIVIDKLIKMTSFMTNVGWSLSILFVLISILIIYNTIRLTIYARSDEIEIMKLVGASDWYVQGPFFIEGTMYGLLASIISSFILYAAIKYSLPGVESYLGAAGAQTIFSGINLGAIIGIQLAVGLILGTLCSGFAVRKYLKV